MKALVLADLRSRWRSLAAMSGGCFVLLLVLCGTYSAFGGSEGFTKSFGSGGQTPKVFSALSGSSSGDVFSPAPFLAFGFGHPLFLVLTLSVAISSGVAAIASEVESGRSELIFTAPIRRTSVLDARVLGWFVAELAVVTGAVVGALVGTQISPDLDRVSLLVPLRVALQFSSLAFFVAGAAFAASAASRTRARAFAVAVGVTAGSYVVNLVAHLWGPLAFARRLTPFGYYSPTSVTHHIAWGDAGVLCLAGLALLVLARWLLKGRDLA